MGAARAEVGFGRRHTGRRRAWLHTTPIPPGPSAASMVSPHRRVRAHTLGRERHDGLDYLTALRPRRPRNHERNNERNTSRPQARPAGSAREILRVTGPVAPLRPSSAAVNEARHRRAVAPSRLDSQHCYYVSAHVHALNVTDARFRANTPSGVRA